MHFDTTHPIVLSYLSSAIVFYIHWLYLSPVGVSPISRPSDDPPAFGYFADIVKNYKAKVNALHNKASGDEAKSADLYSSELDVLAALPSPSSYEGRAVTVRGVATSPKTANERHPRRASSEEARSRGFLSERQRFGDGAKSQQVQQEVMRRPLMLNARPGLERLKLMEEEDSLELGVSRGSDNGRRGRPQNAGEAASVGPFGRPQHDDDDAVNVGQHGRSQHDNVKAVSVGRRGRPQHGDNEAVSGDWQRRPQHGNGEAVTIARSGARHHVVEKSVREPRKDRQPRNKKLQYSNTITYNQFVKLRGIETFQEVNSNKKQDGYFDRKDLNFLISKKKL